MPTLEPVPVLPRPLVAVLHLSFAQWLGGLAVWLLVAFGGVQRVEAGWQLQSIVALLAAIGLGLMGIVLLAGQRNDLRVSFLGAVFLLSASAFSLFQLLRFSQRYSTASPVADILAVVPAEALLPYCLWRFAALFPSALDPRPMRLVLRTGTGLALVGGVGLMVANLAGRLLAAEWLPPIDHRSSGSYFDLFLAAMSLPALAVIGVRFRFASQRDQGRAKLLAVPLALLAGMVLILGAAQVFEFLFTGDTGGETVPFILRLLFLPLALALPPSLALAVTTRQALNVRLVAWRLLADYAKQGLWVALWILPILMFLLTMFARDPKADRWGSLLLLLWFGVSLAAVVAFTRRRSDGATRDLESRGRSRGVVIAVEELRSVATLAEWHQWLQRVPAALEVSSVYLLAGDSFRNAGAGELNRWMPMSAGDDRFSELRSLFSVRTSAIDLENSIPSAEVSSLSETSCRWLSEHGVVLLQPLFATNGELLALFAVGDRVNQRALGPIDRLRVENLAGAMELFLERRLVETFRVGSAVLESRRSSGSVEQSASPILAAVECRACQRVFAAVVARCPDCKVETAPIEAPLILGGKFQLDQCIGVGALGKVYRALDLVLDRKVAIKFIADDTARGWSVLKREARAMAVLENPRLATVYTVESLGDRLFIVCELLEGGTLAQTPGPRPWREVVDLGLELLDALEPLHQRELLHGDLKPSNIGFDGEGRLKLLDFGMVRFLDETMPPGTPEGDSFRSSTVLPGGHVGTPLYSPPEAWRGEPVANEADLWPLAVILWERLSGRHPFERAGEDTGLMASRTRRAILGAEVLPLSEGCACPLALEKLLRKALDHDPANRFVDVRAMRRALLEI